MPGPRVERVTPILNVSNIQDSFTWFEKLGWTKGWEWGTPPDFGGVCAGDCEIFLCLNGQGGRGRSDVRSTFGPGADAGAEKGVWMSMWVDDVDAVHRRCLEQGLEITWPPTDMPWDVRAMEYLKDSDRGVRDYQETAGNRGACLLRRPDGDRVHFLLISLWESREAIEVYAGADIDRAQYFSYDLECLTDPEPNVAHYEVVVASVTGEI